MIAQAYPGSLSPTNDRTRSSFPIAFPRSDSSTPVWLKYPREIDTYVTKPTTASFRKDTKEVTVNDLK
jgi:hypothetical protein